MKQRQLTQEEIDLAPEWATRYFIITCTTIRFESEGYYCYSFNGEISAKERNKFGVDEDSQPIPRKEFDLSYSDASGILDVSVTGDNLGVVTTYTDIGDIYITKQDVINKAKALGVTASDFIDTKPDNAIIDNNETK